MSTLTELAQRVQIAAEDVSSGKVRDNVELMRAIRNLNRLAESPTERLRRILYQTVQCGAVRLAIEMGLPQALVKGKEVTSAELAKETGADQLLVVRVMRALVVMDLCDEIGEEHYKFTPTTKALATPTWTGGTRMINETLAPAFAKVADYYREMGFKTTEKTIFEYTFGKDFWTAFNETPQLHKDFSDYMKGRRGDSPRWLDYFPMSTQVGDLDTAADAVTLVDVGGNLGHDLKLFQQRCPEIHGRLILMDQPDVLNANPDPLEGIEKIPYDFFTPQPVQGAKFYLFRAICHDWPDSSCAKFLGNTISAMKKGYSRLLINDQILPNVGAELHPVMLDFSMMAYFHGMERTERQWRTLLDGVGVEIVRIWRYGGGVSEAVIETRLKE